MADGIVGAISLGFQVTRELATYYSAFKSYHSDVDAVTTRIELVSDVFERLQTTIQHLTLVQINSSEELEKLLITCVGCLGELKAYRDKCKNGKHAPASLKTHGEKIVKRMVYPFRKNSLEGLQRTLDSLVNYMQLMMQVSHLDATHYWNDQMSTRDEHLQHALHIISTEQAVHSLNLSKISSRMAASTQMQQQLCTTVATFRTHIEGNTMFQGHIQSQSTQLAAINNKLDTVVASLQQSATNFPTSRVIRTISINHELQSNPLDLLRCRCPGKRSWKEFTNNVRIGFFWKKHSRHVAQCPLHNPFDTGVTVGVKLLIRCGRAAYIVATGIDFGPTRIAPHICYRNVVSRAGSPAKCVVSHLSCFFLSCGEPHEHLGVVLELIIKALVEIFQKGRASINDIDERGETLFHTIMNMLGNYNPIRPVRDSSRQSDSRRKDDGPVAVPGMGIFKDPDNWVLLNSFIRILSEMGLETNSKDCEGLSPLEILIDRSGGNAYALLSGDIPSLVELECSWNVPERGVFHFGNRIRVYEQVLTHPLNGFTGHTVIHNILQRSEQGLRKQLINKSNFSDELEDLDIMRAALLWPEGLRILVSHGVSPCSLNHDGRSILDEALYSHCDDAVQVLLELDPLPITVHTWDAANQHYLISRSDGVSRVDDFDLLNRVAVELSQRAPGWALHFHGGQPILSNAASHRYLESVFTTLYHVPSLTVIGAQAIWDNGFENINLDLALLEQKKYVFDRSSIGFGTPIWYRASRISLDSYYHNHLKFMEAFRVLEWLYCKGAEIYTLHSEFRTSAGQILAERFIIFAGPLVFPGREFEQIRSDIHEIVCEFRTMLVDVLSNAHHDECNCSCSTAGCDVITSVLKVSQRLDDWRMRSLYETPRALGAWDNHKIKKDIISVIFESVHIHLEQHSQLRQSAIRAMTFDILGLTHTCHSHEHDFHLIRSVQVANQEQVSDIRYVEAEDIQLLEKLLEEFEAIWASYAGTFVGFIEEHWEPRMHVIVEEKNAKIADEGRLREIGVQLQPEELPEKEQWPEDYASLAWFQRALKAVVNDNNFSLCV